MAVVKANAYGHGIVEIARTALASCATWLGVATLDEALLLRRQLTRDTPILVLGYVPPQHLSLASRSKITVTGISLAWVQEASRLAQEPFNFHLKVDTGLNRIGCKTLDEVQEVISIVSHNPKLNLSGVFTHFATATDMTNTSYFQWQLARFHQFLEVIPNRTEKLIHCANSGATLLHTDKVFFDMVRCGSALLGLLKQPSEHPLPFPLQTAISVHSTLDLVKQVNASEKISYGGTYTTTQTEWIGTVPIGYADGWRQNFKPVGVLIEGKRLPIVGRIAMDQLMISLDRMYPIGTRVTFIGQEGNETITLNDIVREGNVLRGEILCSFSSRIPRIYKSDVSLISSGNVALRPLTLLGAIIFFSFTCHS
ncbi:unnamed protein product [Rotaria sp. Silwood2]|nr:unnamed protein product [Rotaria sp. Silwood2]